MWLPRTRWDQASLPRCLVFMPLTALSALLDRARSAGSAVVLVSLGVLTTNTTTTNVSTFFFVLFVLGGRVSPRESSHGARQQPPRSWTDEVVLPLDPDLEPFPCSAKRPVGKKIELARVTGEGTRTPNLLFTRQLRYRLRHASTRPFPLVGVPLPLRIKPASGIRLLTCVESGSRHHPRPSERWYRSDCHTRQP